MGKVQHKDYRHGNAFVQAQLVECLKYLHHTRLINETPTTEQEIGLQPCRLLNSFPKRSHGLKKHRILWTIKKSHTGSAHQAPDTRPKPENPGKNSGKIKVFVSLSACTTHTTDHPNLLQSFDSLVREALIKILGATLEDKQWLQARLAVGRGGLGTVSSLSESCLEDLRSNSIIMVKKETFREKLGLNEDPF